jgi:uncharacterized protein YecE (DUF72 family)
MLQLPPSFGPARLSTLHEYLDTLPKDLEVAVEVRHPDWFTEENSLKLDQMLTEVDASRVVFDVRPTRNTSAPEAVTAQERKPDVPLVAEAMQPFVVVRFISSPVLEENEPYFEEWVPRVAEWLKQERRVHFFVHCPVEELSPGLAREFYQRVSKHIELPPLPWDELERPSSLKDFVQLPLF